MLKKLTAISLILILAFNWYGYRILVNIISEKADARLETRIDIKDYNEEELVEMRVPLNMPYISNQSDFERHYGEIEIDGKLYAYVERKIENGELVVKCIANSDKEKIHDAGNEFYKMTNGTDQNKNDKQSSNYNILKLISADFDDQLNPYTFNPLAAINSKHLIRNTHIISGEFYNMPAQPPDTTI